MLAFETVASGGVMAFPFLGSGVKAGREACDGDGMNG